MSNFLCKKKGRALIGLLVVAGFVVLIFYNNERGQGITSMLSSSDKVRRMIGMVQDSPLNPLNSNIRLDTNKQITGDAASNHDDNLRIKLPQVQNTAIKRIGNLVEGTEDEANGQNPQPAVALTKSEVQRKEENHVIAQAVHQPMGAPAVDQPMGAQAVHQPMGAQKQPLSKPGPSDIKQFFEKLKKSYPKKNLHAMLKKRRLTEVEVAKAIHQGKLTMEDVEDMIKTLMERQ